MNFSTSIQINTDVSKVWAAITDIKNAQAMISGILDLQVLNEANDGEALVGLKWQETRKVFGKEETETMWITDAVENEFYRTRAESHGCIYISGMRVAQHGDGTLLTMEFHGEGVSFMAKVMDKLMGFMMKKPMLKLMDQDLMDIKGFVER